MLSLGTAAAGLIAGGIVVSSPYLIPLVFGPGFFESVSLCRKLSFASVCVIAAVNVVFPWST